MKLLLHHIVGQWDVADPAAPLIVPYSILFPTNPSSILYSDQDSVNHSVGFVWRSAVRPSVR